MKIKVVKKDYKDVVNSPSFKRQKPPRQSFLFATLVRIISIFDLLAVKFKYNKINMDKLNKKEPCIYLMNHSSFIDLKIAFRLIYPRKFNIICTDDAFVGQNLLLRLLGCIPTKKFIFDSMLIRDMVAAKKNKHSILMYPEASYSFDGTQTPLPENIGKFLKFLKMPVVVINTKGAFLRDPLYNNLQIRKVHVSADMTYVLSSKDLEEKSDKEIDEIVKSYFEFDNFKYQQDNKIKVNEPFRADHLNRVLYKCPSCFKEGFMLGKGIHITCRNCNKKHELTEYGYLKAVDGKETFTHIPSWYKYQRECVKKEIIDGKYNLDIDVDIYMMKNFKCIYKVGSGHLNHSVNGFHLLGCEGQIDYIQKPMSSYSLYSDYNWYELGDVICIGNEKVRYYCISKEKKDIVAKTRLATEELYKYLKSK